MLLCPNSAQLLAHRLIYSSNRSAIDHLIVSVFNHMAEFGASQNRMSARRNALKH